MNTIDTPIIHHVSVINRDVEQTFHFYRDILGLDLLMKTVNQDDIDMYHLFFSDTQGRPGTEFTIFQMQTGRAKQFGTNAIERTVFAVPSEEALYFWEERLNGFGLFNCEIENYNNSKILRFEDYDGVQLGLVPLSDSRNAFYGKATEEVSAENAILGIQSVHLRVRYPKATSDILEQYYGLQATKLMDDNGWHVTVLGKENSLLDQEIHLMEDKKNLLEVQGVGSTHHVALAVKNKAELEALEDKVVARNFTNSGIKNREFFYSFYFREPNNVLLETATVETTLQKEPYEGLAFDEIPLYLPSFLEPRRNFIEHNLSI